jgi:hypothetical protein
MTPTSDSGAVNDAPDPLVVVIRAWHEANGEVRGRILHGPHNSAVFSSAADLLREVHEIVETWDRHPGGAPAA